MRILLADDDGTSSMMLGRTLEQWGFDVVVAHDGVDAWERLIGETPPALAIVDWMMPRLDGIDLCRRLRATPIPSPIYIILLTARTSPKDLVAGLEAGADDYLTKPFRRDELRARIHVGERTLALMANIKQLTGLLPICCYCKSVRSDADYWEQVESYISDHSDVRFSHGICPPCLEKAMRELDSTAGPEAADERLDVVMNPRRTIATTDALLERVGGDRDFLRSVIGVFVEQCPRMLEGIRLALDDRDISALNRAAHTFKGSAANFGADTVVGLAQQIETDAVNGDFTALTGVFRTLEAETGDMLADLSASEKGVR